MKRYLEWRCRMNWPGKYLKANLGYVDLWISNVTPTQMEYFVREREHLINNGIYNE